MKKKRSKNRVIVISNETVKLERTSFDIVGTYSEKEIPASNVCREDTLILIYSLNREENNRIKATLVEKGYSEARILEWYYYKQNPGFTKLEYAMEKNSSNYLLGMSHASLIFENMLPKKWVNLAENSKDFWCFWQELSKLENTNKFQRTDTVILEIPYYIFNYDLSRALETLKIRMNYFYYYKAWHHVCDNKSAASYKKQFFIFKNNEMDINKKIPLFIKVPLLRLFRYISLVLNIQKISDLEVEKDCNKIDKVWTDFREETITENIEIWGQIRALLAKYNIKVCILVTPMNPLFINQHKADIERMRTLFYRLLGNDYEVIDLFDRFEYRDFKDHCHVSERGGGS